MSHESLVSSKVFNAAQAFAKDHGQTPKGAFLGLNEWDKFQHELRSHAKYYDPSRHPHRDTTRFQFCGLTMVRVPVESGLKIFGDEFKLGDEHRIHLRESREDAAAILYGGRPPTKKIRFAVQPDVPMVGDPKDWPEPKYEERTVVDEDQLFGRFPKGTMDHPKFRGLDPAFGKEQIVTNWVDPETGRKIIRRGDDIMVIDEITQTRLRIEDEEMLRRILACEPQPGDPKLDPTFHTKDKDPEFGGETL